MRGFARRLARLTISLSAVGALLACANPTQIAPGTPFNQVEAQMGQPNFECVRPDGTRRVIWTMQPAGQFAWGADVLPDDRIDQMQSILTDAYFKRISLGWTADQVRCEFGPPANISGVGLPSVRETVWAYRYKQSNVWNSLMYVYMGRDGNHVTRFHPGPDPEYDEDRLWR